MPFRTIATPRPRARARSALVAALMLLALVAATSATASAALPALSGVAPWSARCYTDTCVGVEVTFDGGHAVALGHPSDSPDQWAIHESSDLTADEVAFAEATVRLRVKGISEHTAAAGNGPVNALDHALRKALEEFYPNLRELTLLDYKVRILDETRGTAAKTRVLVTSGDGDETWGTVGVAHNIIDASWQALVDSVEYKLRRDERR